MLMPCFGIAGASISVVVIRRASQHVYTSCLPRHDQNPASQAVLASILPHTIDRDLQCTLKARPTCIAAGVRDGAVSGHARDCFHPSQIPASWKNYPEINVAHRVELRPIISVVCD